MKKGRIKSLWRFPVKSFQGEELQKAVLGPGGILGDRAYALVEKETGKVVTGKSVRHFPDLMHCRAVFSEEPRTGKEIPAVDITLPDGTLVSSSDANVDQVLSSYFKRDVTLDRSAPEDYTIDQFHPDLDQLDPAGSRNVSVEQKLGSALFGSLGVDSPLPEGSFMDVFPISVITTSTLDELSEIQPETDFNVRRFRMNLVISTEGSGFVENEWVGKQVKSSGGVSLAGAMPDPRCVMTSLAQPGLEKDNRVLKTLVQHNRLDIMGSGKFPCAGLYAVVVSGGEISVGDDVEIG